MNLKFINKSIRLCALFHKRITLLGMNELLDNKIENVLDSADRMFIATSVGGNSSGASVFFSRDGEDLVFFTFNPTRKAEQIRLNPRVHVVIWPKGQEGIEGLQIDGECYKIKDEDEKKKAYEDNINLMYVAFTRPKLGLFIRANTPSKDLKNVSDLLYKSLNNKLINNLYSSGEIKEKENKLTSKSYYLNSFPSYSWRDRIKVKLSSERGIDFKNNEKGNKFHDLMSFIYNFNDVDSGVEKAFNKNIITEKEKSYFTKIIQNLLRDKDIREYYDPKLRSYNEIEILNDNGDVYRLDRVIELDKHSVAVIDYKTGKNKEEDKNQVNYYKELLSKIYKGEVYGFIAYIDPILIIKT